MNALPPQAESPLTTLQNLEPGTCNLESGTWNPEPWNHGTLERSEYFARWLAVFGGARFDDPPDQRRGQRLVERKADRPLLQLVSRRIPPVCAPQSGAHRIHADVRGPRGVPDENAAVEPHGRNLVAVRVHGT